MSLVVTRWKKSFKVNHVTSRQRFIAAADCADCRGGFQMTHADEHDVIFRDEMKVFYCDSQLRQSLIK